MILSKPFAIACSLLSLGAAERQREATGVTSSHHLDPTLVQTLDVLRDGRRRAGRKEEGNQNPGNSNSLGNLRRVQVDDGQPASCEEALVDAQEQLHTCEERAEEPSYLFVQMADQCIFQITDNANLVLKSRHFHEDTVMFSDRPFRYEEDVPTEFFFESFDDKFNTGNGGKPNAAITLFQNDGSKRAVVLSVFVKAVVKHGDGPDGPTYVYKLEQSEDQASVTSLSEVIDGGDKMTYDHCSIFIDSCITGSGSGRHLQVEGLPLVPMSEFVVKQTCLSK